VPGVWIQVCCDTGRPLRSNGRRSQGDWPGRSPLVHRRRSRLRARQFAPAVAGFDEARGESRRCGRYGRGSPTAALLEEFVPLEEKGAIHGCAGCRSPGVIETRKTRSVEPAQVEAAVRHDVEDELDRVKT